MAGGVEIPTLPSASTLDGSELIVVEQGGVTKKSTISASQQIALDAANAAQSTAASAASSATAASTAASTAQTTANSKLSSVSVDGTTITGNGTIGNPLIANVPTLYQQVTKSAFLALVASSGLVAGKSYLVTGAYLSSVFSTNFDILVTAKSVNNISELSWVKYTDANPQYTCFLKCKTDSAFSFMRLYETCSQLFLNQTACQTVIAGADEFIQGCTIFVSIGSTVWKTTIGNSPSEIVVKNALNIDSGTTMYGRLGQLNINANTYFLYNNSSYKSYVALLTQTSTNAPVVTVLENTFSGALTWTYTGVGIYTVTSASNEFTSGRTAATCSITNYFAQNIFVLNVLPTSMELQTLSTSAAGVNGMLTNSVVEIRVY